MAIKFNALTFDIKDILLAIGIVGYIYNSENKQDRRYSEFELKIQQIVSDNKLNEVKVNARFDGLKHSSNDTKNRVPEHTFLAVVNDNRLEIVKRKLVKFKLV